MRLVQYPEARPAIKSITVVSAETLGGDIQVLDTAFGSTVWTANLLIFIPLILTRPCLVAQFFWRNGTVVSGTNSMEVGVYNEDGSAKLGTSGLVTPTGTSAIQVVNVTDFYLPANKRLWLALGCDNATQTFWIGNLVAEGLDYLGVKQQASGWSSGLPASVTFAVPTVAKLPYFGFTGSSVI